MNNKDFPQKERKESTTIQQFKKKARELKQNIGLLYQAYKHPKTP